ncbi:hypothetical protein Tco_0510240, partial [Tanacetum coccineum]
EDGPVDYPIDVGDDGDDDDGDSSRDDADDEDKDEEEEEEHLALVDSAIVLPLKLGSLSGFRLPYPFYQRQRLRGF